MKKQFSVSLTDSNKKWCEANLDDRDYAISGTEIVITYYNEMQKNDILKAIAK